MSDRPADDLNENDDVPRSTTTGPVNANKKSPKRPRPGQANSTEPERHLPTVKRIRRSRFHSIVSLPSRHIPPSSTTSPVPSPQPPSKKNPSSYSQCRSVENYERLNVIDEGTYGRVYKARHRQTHQIYALKQIKFQPEDHREGFPITSLREIHLLQQTHHQNVIHLHEVVTNASNTKIYMVLDYAYHDLKTVLDGQKVGFSASEIKSLMSQLLSGVAYLHRNWILHRDLKSSNLLLTQDGVLKICDFGLARYYGDPLKAFTPGVVTLWYRAPELLLGCEKYSTKVDIWAVGCVFAEIVMLEPLLKGRGEMAVLNEMVDVFGAPREEIWKGFEQLKHAKRIVFKEQFENRLELRLKYGSDGKGRRSGGMQLSKAGVDLIKRMLCYDPEKRISAEEALKHKYFQEAPPPKDSALIQTFPENLRRPTQR